MNSRVSAIVLAGFGGPRTDAEVSPFLQELLTDEDVVWRQLPTPLHRLLFKRIAKKRALTMQHEYAKMGGGSPIVQQTIALAEEVQKLFPSLPCIPFHRYVPDLHSLFLEQITPFGGNVWVFPLFPQFSYATSGSMARWFEKKVPKARFWHWSRSYPTHLGWVHPMTELIYSHLQSLGWDLAQTTVICSAHGVPKGFSCAGDPYQEECEKSVQVLQKKFPQLTILLSYQSKFGPLTWITPSTEQLCQQIEATHVAICPLSFLSDHLETLVEIEEQYLPLLQRRGIRATRIPALGLHPKWIEGIGKILEQGDGTPNSMLIRHPFQSCRCKPGCTKQQLPTHCAL